MLARYAAFDDPGAVVITGELRYQNQPAPTFQVPLTQSLAPDGADVGGGIAAPHYHKAAAESNEYVAPTPLGCPAPPADGNESLDPTPVGFAAPPADGAARPQKSTSTGTPLVPSTAFGIAASKRDGITNHRTPSLVQRKRVIAPLRFYNANV